MNIKYPGDGIENPGYAAMSDGSDDDREPVEGYDIAIVRGPHRLWYRTNDEPGGDDVLVCFACLTSEDNGTVPWEQLSCVRPAPAPQVPDDDIPF